MTKKLVPRRGASYPEALRFKDIEARFVQAELIQLTEQGQPGALLLSKSEAAALRDWLTKVLP